MITFILLSIIFMIAVIVLAVLLTLIGVGLPIIVFLLGDIGIIFLIVNAIRHKKD